MAQPSLTFTVFKSATTRDGTPMTKTADEWAAEFSTHAVLGAPDDQHSKEALDKAKNHRAVVFGEIPEGMTRKGAHVRAVHSLSIDLDACTEEQIGAILLTLKPYTFWAWTTHKSGAAAIGGAVRLRIVLPLWEPLTPADFPGAWRALNSMIGGFNDGATKDIGRLNYYPSTWDATLNPSHVAAWTNRAAFLRLFDLVPYLKALDEAASSKSPERKSAASPSLATIKSKLKRLGREHPHKERLNQLIAGEPFAESGDRHSSIVDLTWTVAEHSDNVEDDTLRALFKPSLDAMRAKDSSCPPLDDVIAAYKGALEKVVAAQAERAEKKKQDNLDRQLQQADPEVASHGHYTAADIARIAEVQGWPEAKAVHNRWVVQLGGGGWILCSDGTYRGPFTRDDLGVAACKFLARAPVELQWTDDRGVDHYKPIGDVVRKSGQIALKSVVELARQYSIYDARNGIMREAPCPLRVTEPAFDKEFDEWMGIAFHKHYGSVVDWLSVFYDLNKMLCAIYFDGPPSSGKTLFAYGLAKGWTEGAPTDIRSLFNAWNDDLKRCPLVLADEEIPKRWHGESVTAVLRSQLSTVHRILRRRYMPEAEMKGCIRLVIAANNEFLLESRDVTSAQDKDAIAQRFMYIKLPEAAVEYINALPRETRERWEREGIARHALYLAEHHKIEKPGSRFYVEGTATTMHRLLLMSSRFNSLVCEVLVRYCMNPGPFRQQASGLIRIYKGELLVNERAIIDAWKLYLPDTRMEPELAKVSSALRAISTGKRTQLRAPGGKRFRYRHVDVANLEAFVETTGDGDKAAIHALIAEGDDAEVEREPGDDDEEGTELEGVGTVNKEPF